MKINRKYAKLTFILQMFDMCSVSDTVDVKVIALKIFNTDVCVMEGSRLSRVFINKQFLWTVNTSAVCFVGFVICIWISSGMLYERFCAIYTLTNLLKKTVSAAQSPLWIWCSRSDHGNHMPMTHTQHKTVVNVLSFELSWKHITSLVPT